MRYLWVRDPPPPGSWPTLQETVNAMARGERVHKTSISLRPETEWDDRLQKWAGEHPEAVIEKDK